MWPVFAFLFGFSWHSGMLLFSYNYFFQKRLIYFCFMYMCESLTLSLSSMCLLCLQTTEEGLGTWSCSYRQLWSAEWMQWREPQSTARAVSICNAWTISLVPCAVILYLVSMLKLPITFYSIYLFLYLLRLLFTNLHRSGLNTNFFHIYHTFFIIIWRPLSQ